MKSGIEELRKKLIPQKQTIKPKTKKKIKSGFNKTTNNIKLCVHPLFFVLALYYALSGKIFFFMVVTSCAVLHELGHSFVAYNNGYRLNKITLMPFGAVVSGDVEGLKVIDQIKIALAGPLVNLSVSIFFVAVWWVFPDCYPYTEVAVQTSFALAVVNLLPAYPLDGGRVCFSLLSLCMNKKKAEAICKWVGVGLGVILLVAFVCSLVYSVNLSLLLFSLFIIFGALSVNKSGRYIRGCAGVSLQSLKRGLPIKRQAIDQSVSVKKLLSLLGEDCLNEVVVYKDLKPIAILSQEKIEKIALSGNLYSPISEFLHK